MKHTRRLRAAALFTATMLFGCEDSPSTDQQPSDDSGPAPPTDASTAPVHDAGNAIDELSGLYRQRGYARLLEFTDRSVRYYDVTEVSCVQSDELPREELYPQHDRVTVRSDGFSWYETGAFTRYDFESVSELPRACTTPDSGPEASFEALWHLFDENYGFFDERGVDWNAAYEEYRPRVTPDTSDDELIEIFAEMLLPFDDGHVYVFDPSSGRGFLGGSLGEVWEQWAEQHEGDDLGENPIDPRGAFTSDLRDYVLTEVLSGRGESGAYGLLHWGWLDSLEGLEDGIAYLDVHAMGSYEVSLSIVEATAVIDEAMARVMRDLGDAEGFIVDVRFNEGGLDSIGYAIAGWFASEAQLISRKRSFIDGEWSAALDIHVSPRPGAYTGPVVLLMGKNSISAAETFAIAMNALPNVTSVGTNTYGSLSDALGRMLPNGWLVSGSNELYESPEGDRYEAVGVPPDVPVEFDPSASFYEQLALTLARGVELLR